MSNATPGAVGKPTPVSVARPAAVCREAGAPAQPVVVPRVRRLAPGLHCCFRMWLSNLIMLVSLGAPEGPGAPVSMDEAVALALARSPALAGADASADAARARIEAADSAWLPRIGVEARYRYQGPVAELVIDTGLTLPGQSEPLVMRRELGTEHNADAFVMAGWRALDFGVRAARIDAAEAMARASDLEIGARRIEVVHATRVAYLALLLAEEGARTTDAALALARETRDDLIERRKAGLGSDLGLAGAELRVAELEARVSEAAESVTRARETLASLAGRPVIPRDTLATVLVGRPTWDREHPTLARLRATEAALDAQERALRKGRAPTLDLFAKAGVQRPATLADTDEFGFAWVAGATLTWEAFDGGRLDAEADEAEARAREARQAREAMADELGRALTDAEARRVGAEAQLAAAERRLAAAQTYLVSARGALQAGTGRATDVQAAEVGVDEARLAHARALYQRALAEAQRRRALGLSEDLATAPSQETAP